MVGYLVGVSQEQGVDDIIVHIGRFNNTTFSNLKQNIQSLTPTTTSQSQHVYSTSTVDKIQYLQSKTTAAHSFNNTTLNRQTEQIDTQCRICDFRMGKVLIKA